MEDIEKLITDLREVFAPMVRELCADDKFDCDELCAGNIMTSECIIFRAASALKRLCAENERLRSNCYPRDGVEAIIRERDKFKAERDAAIEDWRGFCVKCSKRNKRYLSDGQMDAVCATCRANGKCNWEWRGPGAGEGAGR